MKKHLVLLFILSSQFSWAQTLAKTEKFIPYALDSAAVPGLSLAVSNPKGIFYAKAWGINESGKAQKTNTNTVFSAASLSKPVFAYLVLKLHDEGKIKRNSQDF